MYDSYEVIKTINNQEAVVKCINFNFMLFIEEGVKIKSTNSADTIFLLDPLNLPEHFVLQNLEVLVSGEILENPVVGSQNSHPSFYITEILKQK